MKTAILVRPIGRFSSSSAWGLLGLVVALGLCSWPSLRAEPVSLFDGETLEGWAYDPKVWRVEDGVIAGGSATEKLARNSFVSTEGRFSNFELLLTIRCSGDPATGLINSGIQVRSEVVGDSMVGYQVDCGVGWFGKIYDEHRRNRVIAGPIDQGALDAAVDPFGWNRYRILAEGGRIRVWINDVAVTDFTEEHPDIAQDGHIGIQVHSGGACLVEFKDISIRELAATPDAPTWESLGGVEEAVRRANAVPVPVAVAVAGGGGDGDDGGPLTPAEQLLRFRVAEGFEIELVAAESEGIGKFISVYFDQRGRMWAQTALEYPVDANENPAAAEALYAGEGKDKVLVYGREGLNGELPEGGLRDPVVFADGLAIPLGLLPWGVGDEAFVMHGRELKLFRDVDGDGRADDSEVILTGFGIQDSHLLPHQFTYAPGGWIWMAQGLFNDSQVKRPGGEELVAFPRCSMARLRPDGSRFEITSVGPNNIWGLAMTGEGETFIQEANDYGYPAMPFHEGAYYPGGMESFRKSYQPEMPVQAPDFRMGGTGLSGLALGEGGFRSLAPSLGEDGLCLLVANPITGKVQTLAVHRDESGEMPQKAPNGWRLELAQELVGCDDPNFRPVALTMGPDGALYIVDWYNKIISHNEVPRNHPERDKERGRIWRVKVAGEEREYIPDFSALGHEGLIAMLGEAPTGRAHLAWQTLAMGEGDEGLYARLRGIVADEGGTVGARVQAAWVLWEQGVIDEATIRVLMAAEHRNLRRQGVAIAAALEDIVASVRLVGPMVGDPDAEVRYEAIHGLGRRVTEHPAVLPALVAAVGPSLDGPTAPSRGGQPIPVGAAYAREFERFLARFYLEQQPELVAAFLDGAGAADLTEEARMVAALALAPGDSASRVAALLPRLGRAPNDEELLRLAQHLDAPGSGEALVALLGSDISRATVAEQLMRHQTRLDGGKLAPLLGEAAAQLLAGSEDERRAGLSLIGGFQLAGLEAELVAMVEGGENVVAGLQALRELGSDAVELFAGLLGADDPLVREEALGALAASRSPEAGERLLALYPELELRQRRAVLNALSATRAGGLAIVAAIGDGRLAGEDIDGLIAERLGIVLAGEPELAEVMGGLGHVFREVLALDGRNTAKVDSGILLDGPFTVETWVRLAPGIDNGDSLLAAQGGVDMNFFQSTFRVYAGAQLRDVAVSTRPITPELWTHIAVTRDEVGILRIYQNGELDAVGGQAVTARWENCQIGMSTAAGGTEGMFVEYRLWDHERSAEEIRGHFDRIIEEAPGLRRFDGAWGGLGEGASVLQTTDLPPLLTGEEAAELDRKFAKYLQLGQEAGDLEMGKAMSGLCLACHQIGTGGIAMGPDLSGVGAMGLEAILRNLLTPSAAMEAGYRIFRVELESGDVIDAFFVSEDQEAIVVRQVGMLDRRIPKSEVVSTRYIRRSLMPEGLLDGLSDEQVRDLLGYLQSLE